MNNHLDHLKQLLEDATLDDDTRAAILATISELEREHSSLMLQLEEARRSRLEMMYTVAYDIRVQTNLAVGYLDLLLTDGEEELRANFAENAMLHMQKLSNLEDDIIRRNYLEHGSPTSRPQTVSVQTLLQQMKKTFRSAKIDLIAHCDAVADVCLLDEGYFWQVLEYLFFSNGSPQLSETVELMVLRAGNQIQFAFTARFDQQAANRILEVYEALRDEQLYDTRSLEARVLMAYQLAPLAGGSLVIESAGQQTLGILLEFDAIGRKAR